MRIAGIGYATEQGLGRLLKSFYDAGVVTDPIIVRHGKHKDHVEWYPPGTPLVGRKYNLPAKRLEGVQALLAFETFFDWHLVFSCKTRGIKTILCTMYEWTPKQLPVEPDYMLWPSRLDEDMFRERYKGTFLRIPVDQTTWKLRTHANQFLHNAGHIGHREHKGTRQLLEAVQYVENPDFRLTVRAQEGNALKSIVKDNQHLLGDPRVSLEFGDIPYEMLFNDHDVYIAPEKFNGLSLPLQEAYAAGLMVMTTDRYPANTWLPHEPLITPTRYERACISRNYMEFDEAIVEPRAIAREIDAVCGRDISAFSLAGKQWAEANSWEKLKPVYMETIRRWVS